MIPMISAVAAALLFLFAMLSFLAPSPIDSDHMHRRRQHITVNLSISLDIHSYPIIDHEFIIFVFFQYNEKGSEVVEKLEFRVPVRAFLDSDCVSYRFHDFVIGS